MTKDDALKKALEFIEQVNKDGWILADFEPQMYDTITAIKEALAQQPAQQKDIDWKDQYEKQKRRAEMWVAKYEADIKPLEKAGPVTAQQQEPVAWLHNGKLHEFDPSDWATGPVTPLYTSPPAKPWVGLTDEEISKTFETKVWDARRSYARAIEAKLKEKNT